MLTQLTTLAEKSDGRYASDAELEFLKDYLEEIDKRIHTYDKIRNNEDKLIEQIGVKTKSKNPYLFDKYGLSAHHISDAVLKLLKVRC